MCFKRHFEGDAATLTVPPLTRKTSPSLITLVFLFEDKSTDGLGQLTVATVEGKLQLFGRLAAGTIATGEVAKMMDFAIKCLVDTTLPIIHWLVHSGDSDPQHRRELDGID